MHVVFIPYGIKNMVDLFLENLNQRILPLKLSKEGEQDKYFNIQCQIRYLPFGFIEFVFPREYLNQVLTALKFDQCHKSINLDKSILGIKPLKLIKKALNLEDIPKYEKVKGFPVLDLPVSIIPIGIRKDADLTEPCGEFKGWRHESI